MVLPGLVPFITFSRGKTGDLAFARLNLGNVLKNKCELVFEFGGAECSASAVVAVDFEVLVFVENDDVADFVVVCDLRGKTVYKMFLT